MIQHDSQLLGISASMTKLREEILQYSAHDIPILITGETGTGKELVAKALHQESQRNKHNFVAINCSGITESLLTSELFGHVRGAFTGALKTHKGLIEEAGPGTLFLDEIANMPSTLQTTLLRVLENREYRPVGSSASKKVRCHIIAATNVALETLVKEGRFRADLLFRLKRLPLYLPPLREHVEDLEILVDHYLNLGRQGDKRAQGSPALLATLKKYPWPGNVRELRNVIEQVRVLHSDKLQYDTEDLDSKITGTHDQRSFSEFLPFTLSKDGNQEARSSLRKPFIDPSSSNLQLGRKRLLRLEKIRECFRQNLLVAPSELKNILNVSLRTIAKDLNTLKQEGFIIKKEGSHFYTLLS